MILLSYNLAKTHLLSLEDFFPKIKTIFTENDCHLQIKSFISFFLFKCLFFGFFFFIPDYAGCQSLQYMLRANFLLSFLDLNKLVTVPSLALFVSNEKLCHVPYLFFLFMSSFSCCGYF